VAAVSGDERDVITPAAAVDLCVDAHRRLLDSISGLTDDVAHRPSHLPGWTVGHVLTHIARNADGHTRRLEGALRGDDVARYPGGSAQRGREIEEGASRGAAELVADVGESATRLQRAWVRSADAGWPNAAFMGADHWPTNESPLRRLREVEVHRVDLGMGYRPEDWPDVYVRWELSEVVRDLPRRVGRAGDESRLLAWLIGRAGEPEVDLKPW